MHLTRSVAFVLCSSLAFVSSATADVVADWNVIALDNLGLGRPVGLFGLVGPATSIDLALMHLAMHDAVQAYDKRFETYSVPVVATSGSPIVAAARAAHDVLAKRLELTPAVVATIDTAYTNYINGLNPMPSAPDIADGEAVGRKAAENVLALRVDDGSFPTGAALTNSFFFGGTGPGEWQPNPVTPPAIDTGMVAAWLGDVRPLAVSPDAVQPDTIPPLASQEYAEAYNEVKALGSATSTRRTGPQSEKARFFSGNIIAMLNRLMRELSAAHLNGSDLASLGDRARLFALTTMAAADAVICAWHSKKQFNFWRPIHAIRNGDQDGNARTERDANWVPYLGTPNYPDYTSGFNNVTGAMTGSMALFFGSDRPFDKLEIYAIGNALALLPDDANPRTYTRFSDIQEDAIDVRVYQGIHYRFADTEARSQGKRVARYVFRNLLQEIQIR
jgi:hypothetical protein